MKIVSTLVILSALVAAASAQNQQQQQQGTPVPTTVAPTKGPVQTAAPTKGPVQTAAPTTAPTKGPVQTAAPTKPAATTAAPTKPAATPAASVTKKPAATPAATTTTKYDPKKGCWSISVERDATYCISGPICSGSGKQPAGWNCPKKGDVATERCLPYLKSYTSSGKCVAPVDAECKVIHTGAWGCVLKGDNSTGSGGKATPAPTKGGNGTAGGNKTTNGTKADNGTIQAPTKLTKLAGVEGAGSSAAVVGAVAAVAAVAAAAIGTVLYKKNQSKAATAEGSDEVVDVVTP